ncbi:UPF0565 protein C2orf69 homolog [Monomorium pharaonis]|uniref:UPF0565 protein C2orf69 homolog n=1 Tax=Monomorium pharaonis TaxID=307658 RepID=UPI00063F0976|nr:UPF0565 protein C2orf69 homolog [Monomorium pharaonis]
MDSKTWIWRYLVGVLGRYNDVVYRQPKFSTRDFLIFFGGDVQDIEERMERHSNSKKYMKWSLENTVAILSEQFPRHHIFAVRPFKVAITKNAVFNCFDNFVLGNEYGTPTFSPMHYALKNLRELLVCCLEYLKELKLEKDIDTIESTNLSLMGFSKGCAVLNQFLHEFHYYDENPNEDPHMNNFIKLIKDMWWLDGGHNGPKDTWITDQTVLHSFAKLGIHAHIHVTPYQVQDQYRPHIQMEENSFTVTLQKMGVPVERTLHFADQARCLSSHFNVLTVIRNDVQ